MIELYYMNKTDWIEARHSSVPRGISFRETAAPGKGDTAEGICIRTCLSLGRMEKILRTVTTVERYLIGYREEDCFPMWEESSRILNAMDKCVQLLFMAF